MENQFIGQGVYGLSEASKYIRVNYNVLRQWFRATKTSPVFTSDYSRAGVGATISFLDMVDALVVGEFRKHGVTLQHVRKVYDHLFNELGPHPFSRQEVLVDTSTRRILSKIDETIFDTLTKQAQMQKILDAHLVAIQYSNLTKLAERWFIRPGIVLDPKVHFGKPVIADTGVTTYVLARAFQANKQDAKFVARMYELDVEDVKRAVAFEASLVKAA